jgi:hypothetical protein
MLSRGDARDRSASEKCQLKQFTILTHKRHLAHRVARHEVAHGELARVEATAGQASRGGEAANGRDCDVGNNNGLLSITIFDLGLGGNN